MKKTIILTFLSLFAVIISSSLVDARALPKNNAVAVHGFNLEAENENVDVIMIHFPVIGARVEDKIDNMFLGRIPFLAFRKPVLGNVMIPPPKVLDLNNQIDSATTTFDNLDFIIEVDAGIEFE